MVKVINVSSLVEADQLMSLLHDNGIEAYKSSTGSGGYMSIIGNYSAVGYDIMVDEDSLDKASEILKELYDVDDTEYSEEDEANYAKGLKMQRLVIRVFALIAAVAWLAKKGAYPLADMLLSFTLIHVPFLDQ